MKESSKKKLARSTWAGHVETHVIRKTGKLEIGGNRGEEDRNYNGDIEK